MKGSQRRILIVEDNESIRKALQRGLEYEGFDVRTAVDGRNALACLEERPLPHLILLDLLLPEMDGFEFLDRMRKHSASPVAKIPVIVVSAVAHRPPKPLPQVDAIFEKPIDLNELTGAIRRVLTTFPSQ
jgi:CheY-like chemotaxis protein